MSIQPLETRGIAYHSRKMAEQNPSNIHIQSPRTTSMYVASDEPHFRVLDIQRILQTEIDKIRQNYNSGTHEGFMLRVTAHNPGSKIGYDMIFPIPFAHGSWDGRGIVPELYTPSYK